MGFQELGLNDKVLRSIAEAGYEEPTPIQKQAIPYVLKGRDVVACAQTGTGKTASFTLPMIDILSRGRARARMPRSLVLSPTRELATQIAEDFKIYGKHCKLSMALLIGGVSYAEQDAKLSKGVDVLIATPGRLLDHFQLGKLLLSGIDVFVIDEADRMLDMGFIPDIERIAKLLTKKHQTLLFSATMPVPVRKLAEKFLKNPEHITITPAQKTGKNIEQYIVEISKNPKARQDALLKILKDENPKNAIVFCNRKRDIANVTKALKNAGYFAEELHGDMDQRMRQATYDRFKDNQIRVLVASDVAARGLDVDALSHVINYDVPMNEDDYIHRIGRTGRAGLSGRAFTLASPLDTKALQVIKQHVEQDIQIYKPTSGKISASQERKAPKSHKTPPKVSKSQNSENSGVKGFGEDVPSFFESTVLDKKSG